MANQQTPSLNYCVIVPTYNNERTLEFVLSGILKVTSNLIVVNDGSTDSTPEILKKFNNITQVDIPVNLGKGNALRQGFAKSLALGFNYAIAIDSDGQHFPEDIPLFLDFAAQNPDVLIIGARNMKQEGVPGKSSFGNKFSNFWFWVESGIKLSDTQSGFRWYPIHKMPKKWFTKKFEFEIENIVRSAWRGIPVVNIPIQIKYDPEERVSHFRPFKDFTRISILRVFLVTIALLYIKPRDFIRSFKKKSIKRFFLEDVLGSTDSPKVKSASLALGVFFGIAPFWGFQTAIVIFLAILFRLNKVLAFAASNISIPPMIPLIVLASLKIGGLFFQSNVDSPNITNFEAIGGHLKEYIVGSFILASIAAFIVGTTSYMILISMVKKRDE
jgi:glycosyltransferase involved in cell wall biosynthesis